MGGGIACALEKSTSFSKPNTLCAFVSSYIIFDWLRGLYYTEPVHYTVAMSWGYIGFLLLLMTQHSIQ